MNNTTPPDPTKERATEALLSIQKQTAELISLMPAGMPPEMREWKERVVEIWRTTLLVQR